MVDHLIQAWILFTGVTALLLTIHGNELGRILAPFIGLAGQPAWVWSAYQADQMGILLVTGAYTLVWLSGCVKSIRTVLGQH